MDNRLQSVDKTVGSVGNLSTVTVMIMAGGTGGHVIPGLALAKKLMEAGAKVIWLGTEAGIESKLVPNAGIEIHYIKIQGVRGSGTKRLLLAPFKILAAMIEARNVIIQNKVDIVYGFGGFASGPGGIAAYLAGKPLVLHEQNAVVGTTNRLLAPFAKRVYQAFPSAFSPENKKVVTIGNPVREEIIKLGEPLEIEATTDEHPTRILILGGSLGAKALNEMLPEVLSELSESYSFELKHQCGPRHIDACRNNLEKFSSEFQNHTQLYAFIDDMADAYNWADIIVCRAGALTVSEVACAGKCAVFIPFPYAIDDHQTKNAMWLSEAGAAVLLDENSMNNESLKLALTPLLSDSNHTKMMGKRARSLAQVNACHNLAISCKEILHGN